VEAPRLLAAKSEYGYTDRIDRAMRDEPEAVSAEEQRLLTRRATLVAVYEARLHWDASRIRIRAELASVADQGYAHDLGPELRLMERQLQKLELLVSRKLADLSP
jgi:hypothetical protein